MEIDLCRWSLLLPYTPLPETQVPQYGRDWGLELRLWRLDLGRELGLAEQKQPEETAVHCNHI